MLKKILIIFMAAGLFMGAFDLMFSDSRRKTESISNSSSPLIVINPETDIGVIEINGAISFSTSGMFERDSVASKAIKDIKYFTNSKVKALIIRINSPGGTPSSVQEICYQLEKFKEKDKNRKIVISVKEMAASGGYYIAAYGDKIVANPASILGSIGVIMTMPNFTGLFEKLGIRYNVVKSGKYKDIGNIARDMEEEEKELLQSSVDDIYLQFVEAVSAGRNLSKEKVVQYADGRMFTGRQAVELDFADYVGDMDKAVEVIKELTGIKKNHKLIYPTMKNNFWEILNELSY